eukprot:TRINITY_DN10397_c0_g1_i1.p1 TRINITY_DN10397_c0_g1~~TRINITY_DN10397_c0_g1_i1.p1  ORF type:complete len:400 (+),score=96.75 TRINITY_DN10397_c0_g1_i1:54-1202(+)
MTLGVFSIVLNKPSKAYFAGEFLTGWVLLSVNSEESVRSVKLSLYGGEHTMVQERIERRDGDRVFYETIDHYDNVIHVNTTVCVFGNVNSGSRVPLVAGMKYAFPFQIPIPQQCPTTCFLSRHCYIQYVLHAEVDRPWAFDYNAYEYPIIVAPVDCNSPAALSPRQVGRDHQICCWPCSPGHVVFSTQIPVTGYTAGEQIPASVEVNNQSTRQVQVVNLTLVRRVNYSARGHGARLFHRVSAQQYPIGQAHIDGNIVVPPNLDVTTFNGRLINVEYFLQTEVVIEGACIPNTREEIPILIGNIYRQSQVPVVIPVPASNPVFASNQEPQQYNEMKMDKGGEVGKWPVVAPPPPYSENQNINRDDLFKQMGTNGVPLYDHVNE